MTDPVLVATELLQRVLGFVTDKNERLDELIRLRQTLISAGILLEVLTLEGIETADCGSNPRLEFLRKVYDYHIATIRKEKVNGVWLTIGAAFEKLEPITPMVGCYAQVYLNLCQRNGGSAEDLLDTSYRAAMAWAQKLDSPLHYEAIGHIQYNAARRFHQRKRFDDALVHWQSSARARFLFYAETIRNPVSFEEERLAVAQQLAKLRSDFPAFFPSANIDDCSVDADVYAAMQLEYGERLTSFSAKPS